MWNKRRIQYQLWLFKITLLSFFNKKSLYSRLLKLKKININVYDDIIALTELSFPIHNYNGFYSIVSNFQTLIYGEEEEKKEKVLELLPKESFYFLSLRDWYLVENRPIINNKTLFQDFIKLSLEFYYYFEILNKTTDTTKHHYRIRLLTSFKQSLDTLLNELSNLILK